MFACETLRYVVIDNVLIRWVPDWRLLILVKYYWITAYRLFLKLNLFKQIEHAVEVRVYILNLPIHSTRKYVPILLSMLWKMTSSSKECYRLYYILGNSRLTLINRSKYLMKVLEAWLCHLGSQTERNYGNCLCFEWHSECKCTGKHHACEFCSLFGQFE